ncbi:hypothetical protein H0H92_003573 [Tricholoma furcatifolium]|nr:hypothetical protein H0H92_003573 [Tricholoma furcatifolium]
MSAPRELDCDTAARLLSRICPDSIKGTTEIELGTPESFAYLLFRSNKLCIQVKEAMDMGNFEEVWKTCLLVAQPDQSESQGYDRRRDIVPHLLDGISNGLEELVNGKVELPLWSFEPSTLPGVVTMDLDSYGSERAPSKHIREEPKYILSQLLRHRTHMIEAGALSNTLNYGFNLEDEVMTSLPPASALSFDLTLSRNREVTNRRFSLVLLAHLLIFRDFLKAASKTSGGITDVHKHRWLVAQLLNNYLDTIRDIYGSILTALQWESLTFINEKLKEVFNDICLMLPDSIKTRGLFLVLDEANSALTELWRSHAVDTESYPLLKELINVWKEQLAPLDIPITFVVAGTEIPFRYFPPSSQEWSSWRWTSDTGAFDTPEAQRQYLASLLPASFLDTPSGQALVRRAWDWCGSRHRLTASLVHMLLKDNLAHPHGVFNLYIKELTMHEPRDADDFVALEGLHWRASRFTVSGHGIERYPCARFTTHGAIFHYIVTGQSRLCFDTSKIELVTAGVGEFVDKDMKLIALDQRILIISVAAYLSRYDRIADKNYSLTSFADFCSYFQDRWSDGDTYVARNYIAFALAHVFAEGRALSEVFTISAPGWIGELSESASLVVLRKDASGFTRELVLDSSALLPSAPPLGFVACTADDVIAWLNHERSAAFCFCPPECGAELIFILKIKKKNFWVVLRTAGRGTQTPDIHLHEEFESLDLKNLFPDPTLATHLSDAFNTLPYSASILGNTSVLRVLASFPSQPKLLPNVTQRLNEPLAATLNNVTFKSATESIEGSTIIEALISSMQDKRGEYTDAMFNVIPSESNQPPSKSL